MIGILLLVSADQVPDELLARLQAGELVGLGDAAAMPVLADLAGLAVPAQAALAVDRAALNGASVNGAALNGVHAAALNGAAVNGHGAGGGGLATATATRSARGLRLDPDHRTVVLDGRVQPLTFLEYQLLSHLMSHPRQVQSRARLITKVWDFDPIGSGRSVDVLVARLRRKLGPTYRASIETVRSAGYRYVPPGEWEQ